MWRGGEFDPGGTTSVEIPFRFGTTVTARWWPLGRGRKVGHGQTSAARRCTRTRYIASSMRQPVAQWVRAGAFSSDFITNVTGLGFNSRLGRWIFTYNMWYRFSGWLCFLSLKALSAIRTLISSFTFGLIVGSFLRQVLRFAPPSLR